VKSSVAMNMRFASQPFELLQAHIGPLEKRPRCGLVPLPPFSCRRTTASTPGPQWCSRRCDAPAAGTCAFLRRGQRGISLPLFLARAKVEQDIAPGFPSTTTAVVVDHGKSDRTGFFAAGTRRYPRSWFGVIHAGRSRTAAPSPSKPPQKAHAQVTRVLPRAELVHSGEKIHRTLRHARILLRSEQKWCTGFPNPATRPPARGAVEVQAASAPLARSKTGLADTIRARNAIFRLGCSPRAKRASAAPHRGWDEMRPRERR